MGKLKKSKGNSAGKTNVKTKNVKAKRKGFDGRGKGKAVKTKAVKTKAVKTKSKAGKRAGADAGRNATLAFNISGCSPRLVKALDKAAVAKANKDGHRVSRSRLINAVLEQRFL